MKYIITAILWLSAMTMSFAQSLSTTNIQAYIKQYKSMALEQERLYGIPAPITLAQGILESCAGQSPLATEANNHFGIKALGYWPGEVYLAWDDEPQKSRFRCYESADDSFLDHSKLIKENSRYQSLFDYSVFDYRSWAIGLQKAGYATAKNYAKALIGYIDAYQLYAINGGVKLKPSTTAVMPQTVTIADLTSTNQFSIDNSEATEEEMEVTRIVRKAVVAINDVRCTILFPGETLSSIAMKYNIEKDKLLKYNETGNEFSIKEGDIVYLEKKKRKYYGPKDYYRVKPDETLYDIAQQFGIKTQSLAKMNHKNPLEPLREGEKLRLK